MGYLDERPKLGLVVGPMMIGIALLIVVTSARTSLHCERADGTARCHGDHQLLPSPLDPDFGASKLWSISVATSSNKEGLKSYTAILDGPSGSHTLGEVTKNEATALPGRFRRWMTEPTDAPFGFVPNNRIWFSIIWAAFIGGAGLFFLRIGLNARAGEDG